MTDDAAVAEAAGHPVHVFDGDPANFKVTTMSDLRAADERLAAPLTDVRVGQGFDVHAFAEGDAVWLGGVKIPHTHKLDGHSDADVVLHALCDAIYGALGEGDIGFHFPPSEAKWRGAPSSIFLAHAAERVRARGGRIGHLDVNLVCEAPQRRPASRSDAGPHRRDRRDFRRPRRGQGDDGGKARFCRPRRGGRLHGAGDAEAAGTPLWRVKRARGQANRRRMRAIVSGAARTVIWTRPSVPSRRLITSACS